MKKHLLTAMMAVFSATAMAQYTQETALDLVPGTNTCTLEESGGMAYWKYTPGENTLITITPSSGYVQAYTINEEDGSGTQNTLLGVTKSNQQTVYYLDKGTTCYFRASGSLDVSFDATMQTDGNVGKGFSADDPVIITEGEEMYMGRSVFTSNGQTTYASYTATGDGVLVLRSTGYAYVSVNGGENTNLNYSEGSYLYNLAVEGGQVYNLTFSQHYNPFILTAEMTNPQPGSLDMPFTLNEGANSVPAENGEYWFTYTNSKEGFGVTATMSALKCLRQVLHTISASTRQWLLARTTRSTSLSKNTRRATRRAILSYWTNCRQQRQPSRAREHSSTQLTYLPARISSSTWKLLPR